MSEKSLRERLARHADAGAPVRTPMRAEDALKYAAAILRDRIGWATEAIGYSDECGNSDSEPYGDDVHETELAAIKAVVHEIRSLAAEFGDPRRYSDGRPVETCSADIIPTYGSRYWHIWHPDPSQEKPRTVHGELLSDPGVPCPGRFEVSTDPTTQQIDLRVVRTE